MNIFYKVWTCEVKGSLVIVVISKAFSFTDFVVSYISSLVVYNVDPNLSLVAPTISKAFSFANLSIFNVLSFIVLIDLTFSLATIAVLKTFYFVSSTIEPTHSFPFLTFSWAFSAISLVFCYTFPKDSTTFYFNCSKIEPTPKSYSFWATSYWASSFATSSSLCGFSSNVPKFEATRSLI